MSENKPAPPAPTTLKEMFDEWHSLMAAIDDADGELSPEIEARLALLDLSMPRKIDAWCYVMERLEAEVDFWSERKNTAAQVQKRYEKNLEFVKFRIKQIMQSENVAELPGDQMRLSLRKGKQKLVCPDETVLPIKYFKEVMTYELDKDLLRADLEAGVKVEGAHLEEIVSLYRNTNSRKVLKAK